MMNITAPFIVMIVNILERNHIAPIIEKSNEQYDIIVVKLASIQGKDCIMYN